MYQPVFEYTVRGKQYRLTGFFPNSNDWSSSVPKIDEKRIIWINPDDPNDAFVEEPTAETVIVFAIGLLFSVIGLGFLFMMLFMTRPANDSELTIYEQSGMADDSEFAIVQSNTADDGEFTIYGEWRYVITKGEFGDTYVEERLSTSVLRIIENYDNGTNIKVEFIRGSYVYHGYLRKTDEYVYQFNYMSVTEYGEYEMNDTLIFDPTIRRLGLQDGESGTSITYYVHEK